MQKNNPAGRPPKFREARRPITVTLPERTLKLLAVINQDRAKAIVKAVDAVAGADASAIKPLEILEVAPGKAILLVGPNKYLKQIPFLDLIEIAPARYLLAITSGTAIESLEVAVADLLEDLPADEIHEKQLLEQVRRHITSHRRGKTMTKAELLFVDTKPGDKHH